MGGLFQPMHLLLILVIVLIIFGPSKLGNIGKELGKGIKGFKDSMSDDQPAQPAPTATPAPAPTITHEVKAETKTVHATEKERS